MRNIHFFLLLLFILTNHVLFAQSEKIIKFDKNNILLSCSKPLLPYTYLYSNKQVKAINLVSLQGTIYALNRNLTGLYFSTIQFKNDENQELNINVIGPTVTFIIGNKNHFFINGAYGYGQKK